MKKLIFKNIFVVLLAVIAASAQGADVTVQLISQDFEDPGQPSGWGFYVSPSGSTSTSWDWADNGPSKPGVECALCYSLAAPAGPATFYSIYSSNLDLPVLEQVPFKKFNVSVDVKNSWENAYTYWYFWANFDDGTSESFNSGVTYVNPLNTWVTLPATHTLTNQSKNVKSVKIAVYVHPYGVAGYNTCFDNIIISGVRGPKNCEEVESLGYSIVGDLDGDCRVGFGDIAFMAGEWLDCFDPAITNCSKPWQ